MKNQIQIITLILVSLVLTSCLTLHTGNYFNTTQVNTNNFRYVRQNAEGSSVVTYFLGLGGGRKAALIADAKQSLLISNPLKDNQALVNLNINYKYTSVLGVIYTVTCTINADIIEFVSENPLNPSSAVIRNTSGQEEDTHTSSTTLTTGNVEENSTNELSTSDQAQFSPGVLKVGDKVVFKYNMAIRGVEREVQINNGIVKYIEGDDVTISYSYSNRKMQITLDRKNVFPATK